MTDEAMERARIDALTMEETEAEAWETYGVEGERVRLAWWYEGAPHWYDRDPDAEYRTAVVFGFGPHPELAGWKRVGTFALGERECPMCAPDVPERPATGTECPMCGCLTETERSGHIYLGEDCAEAVYRRRRIAPDVRAHLTEDGFRIEVYDGGTLDPGLRVIAPGGKVIFEAPSYLDGESWGTDGETGEPWSAEHWQEALADEAEAWLDESGAPNADMTDALATLRAAGWYCEHDCGGVYRWRRDRADGRVMLATDDTCGADLTCGEIFVGIYPDSEAIETASYGAEMSFPDLRALAFFIVLGVL